MLRISAALIALLGVSAFPSAQAGVIFDNGPPDVASAGTFFTVDSGQISGPITIAEDFTVADRASLTGLTWWTRDNDLSQIGRAHV